MKRLLKPKLFFSFVTVVLLASAIVGSVAANFIRAHAQAPLAVTLTPTSGPPGTSVTATGTGWVAGSPITIFFDTTALPSFTPTASSWTHTFTVPTTATIGKHTVVFSERAPAVSLTVGVPFTVTPTPRIPLVIFLQGINTELTNQDIKTGPIGVGLGSIPTQVIKALPPNAEFLNYSYKGSDGTGNPKTYKCELTFTNPVLKDIKLLNEQITKAVGKRTNIDIYLIGHSLGGVVAFGYMASLEQNLPGVALPTGARLKAVVTLDSPIGGVAGATFKTFAKFLATVDLKGKKIGGFPCEGLMGKKTPLTTVDDLVKVFNSASPTTPTDDGLPGSDPQGALASILAISGVKLPFSLVPSNEQVAESAQTSLGTSFLSIGTREDFLWNPGACGSNILIAHTPGLSVIAAIMRTVPDFTDTQFLEDEGDNSGLYGRSFNVPGAILGIHMCDIASMLDDLNHLEVLNNGDVLKGLTHFLSPLGATPDPLAPVPSKDTGQV